MSIQVNEFYHKPGVNDSEYIKLLKEALERQTRLTSKAISKLKEKHEWVSVNDRLPTYKELHDEQVLALFEDGDIASIGFDECMEPDEYFGYWHQNFDPETLGATDSEWIAIPYVTHWMKKPELPEEGK